MAVQVVFKDGEEVDGADGGCLVGMVCHAGFHLSQSKVELDEVGVGDELDKTKVDIATFKDKFTVARVNGILEDEVDVEESKEGTTPMLCTIHSCNSLTNEHAARKLPSLSSASAI